MNAQETAVSQAEFLNALSSLLKKYDAEFVVEACGVVCIMACDEFILGSAFNERFDVDACIAVTQRTINRAMAVDQNFGVPDPQGLSDFVAQQAEAARANQ